MIIYVKLINSTVSYYITIFTCRFYNMLRFKSYLKAEVYISCDINDNEIYKIIARI